MLSCSEAKTGCEQPRDMRVEQFAAANRSLPLRSSVNSCSLSQESTLSPQNIVDMVRAAGRPPCAHLCCTCCKGLHLGIDILMAWHFRQHFRCRELPFALLEERLDVEFRICMYWYVL